MLQGTLPAIESPLQRNALALRLPSHLVDFAAECYAAVHDAASGMLCHGHRRPRYWAGQLRGEHVLGLEDVARLVVEAPALARPLVETLARALGFRLVPVSGIETCLLRAAAEVVHSSAAVHIVTFDALADERLTRAEREALYLEVRRLNDRVAVLEASLAAVAA